MMKKACSLFLAFIIIISTFSACSCQSQEDRSSFKTEKTEKNEIIDSLTKSNSYNVLSKIDIVDKQYVGFDSNFLYIADKLREKPKIKMKQPGISSMIYSSDIIVFSVVKNQNSSQDNSDIKLTSSVTEIFALRIQDGYKYKIASIKNSELSLLGIYDDSLILSGLYKKTSRKKCCIRYSLKSNDIKLEIKDADSIQLVDKYLIYNLSSSASEDKSLYFKDLNNDYLEKLFNSASISKTFSIKKPLSVVSNFDDAESDKKTSFVYNFNKQLDSVKSIELPFEKNDVSLVYNDGKRAIVLIEFSVLTEDQKDGYYLFDLETGEAKFLFKQYADISFFKGKTDDEITISTNNSFYRIKKDAIFEIEIKDELPKNMTVFNVINNNLIILKNGVFIGYKFVKTKSETVVENSISNENEEITTESDISQNETIQKDNENQVVDNNSQNIVVVLDAGHDDFCRRDHPNLGVNEQDLNLSIALACYNRLKQYNGVDVYLTRSDGTCLDPSGNGDCIPYRTQVASDKKADLFVSLHCNGLSGVLGESANGASVIISNSPKFNEFCTPLGNLILRNISSYLDIASNGLSVDVDESKGVYEDGSTKDRFYLISNNIDEGRPSIIVEHAFMDNIHDNAILKDEKNLKRLGEADADAIAEFYNLTMS